MKALVQQVEARFRKRRTDIAIFAKEDSRLEGWFKAEMMILLAKLQQSNRILSHKREANVRDSSGAKKSVDFRIVIGQKNHLCEIKAFCISQAARTPRNLSFYFQNNRLGIFHDMQKLDKLNMPDCWILAFIYPCPTSDQWKQALSRIPVALNHWKPVTTPASAIKEIFVSLWKS